LQKHGAQSGLARVPQFLRDLDDDAFPVRQKAKAELARLGKTAEPALRQALTKSPSPEMRRSLEQLLKELDAKRQTPFEGSFRSKESLHGVRAVEVLEQIGTAEARAVLETLANDAPVMSALAREAQAALDHLERARRR
jgi:hypothetical protein